MYNTTPNNELRRAARQQLKGNWGAAILACVIYTVIMALISLIGKLYPVTSSLITFLITGPLMLGIAVYFLKLIRIQEPILNDIFSGFSNFGKSLGLYLLVNIFIILWSILLIIPGIIMFFAYSQVFYIVADNPNMKIIDIIKTSKAMMKGYKFKLFLLYLSFIGWALLCVITLGIGLLWFAPYVESALANFYEDIKNAYLSNQP